MKWLLTIMLLYSVSATAQDKSILVTPGINYKGYPIDIEDVPRGGVSSGKGQFYGWKFWEAWSVNAQAGLPLNKNWVISVEGNVRYNHFHWTEGYNRISDSVSTYNDRSFTKNVKYDVFITTERLIHFKKKLNGNFL